MNTELTYAECSLDNQIQEVRLPSGHWVLVETLGELYPTRDAARADKRRIIVSRRQGKDELKCLEWCFEEAAERMPTNQAVKLFEDIMKFSAGSPPRPALPGDTAATPPGTAGRASGGPPAASP